MLSRSSRAALWFVGRGDTGDGESRPGGFGRDRSVPSGSGQVADRQPGLGLRPGRQAGALREFGGLGRPPRRVAGHRAGGLRRVEAGQARQHGAEPGLGREHPRFSRPGCGSAHRARCFPAEQADQHRRYGLTGVVRSAGIHDHAGQVAVRAVEG